MVKQAARARLAAILNQQISIPVTLRYDSADPLAVHIDFPGLVSRDGKEMTWSFARELLANGLRHPTGMGDVHIWPSGRAHTVMEFQTPEGRASATFDTPALHRFLLRSYRVVEQGTEVLGPALERHLTALLDEV
ncbi:SsgA family sporulation/cell division regulator [Streptomyces sp. S.PB5]|uniref:SsgA family sporulation/cell division regulator n=1 Tax=Streptomyces sp. S.PB5 TaxID=3020844 RepID=UPI00339D42F5